MKTIQVVTIQFPDIELKNRDAHKLRGYFGNLFKQESPLLHNHFEDGTLRHRYPLVQYKVVDKIPTLVGIAEGSELLINLFLQIKKIEIEGHTYPVTSKDIQTEQVEIGYTGELYEYEFNTLWMALNQTNHNQYKTFNKQERQQKLKRILIGNLLSFYKAMGVFLTADERVMVHVNVEEKSTLFKEQQMIAFSGKFTSNMLLPNLVGLGKSVARGFGSITKKG